MPSVFDRKEKGPYDDLNIYDTIELLKEGADIEATDANYNTPLINAASSMFWGYNTTCEEILELGANIDAKGSNENTALCFAAMNGNVELCKFLIEAGADVTISNYDGANVYFLAAAQGLTEICLLLIEEGKIDRDCTNTTWSSRESGANALLYAAHGPATGSNLHSQTETCKALLETGIDINHTDDLGQTALYRAVGAERRGSAETAKILMEAGADLNIVSKFGTNALWRAGYSGLLDVCKLMIEQGGDIPMVGDHCNSAVREAGKVFTVGGRGGISKPYTALMVASSEAAQIKNPAHWNRRNAIKMVKLLVEAGSDVNAATEMGTAWSIAKDWENEDIMNLLEELGANPQ